MGTIIFLIFRFAFGFNHPADYQVLSLLISIDTLIGLFFIKFFVLERKKN
ncbi:hypothetical protein ACFL20_01110 [Spirochaetota bacterium]